MRALGLMLRAALFLAALPVILVAVVLALPPLCLLYVGLLLATPFMDGPAWEPPEEAWRKQQREALECLERSGALRRTTSTGGDA